MTGKTNENLSGDCLRHCEWLEVEPVWGLWGNMRETNVRLWLWFMCLPLSAPRSPETHQPDQLLWERSRPVSWVSCGWNGEKERKLLHWVLAVCCRHSPRFVLTSWGNWRRKAMVLSQMWAASRGKVCATEHGALETGVNLFRDAEHSAGHTGYIFSLGANREKQEVLSQAFSKRKYWKSEAEAHIWSSFCRPVQGHQKGKMRLIY